MLQTKGDVAQKQAKKLKAEMAKLANIRLRVVQLADNYLCLVRSLQEERDKQRELLAAVAAAHNANPANRAGLL